MNEGKTVFAQVMEFLPMYEFRKCVERYRGDYKVLSFTCLDQFLCMAFAQTDISRKSSRHPGLLALKAKQTVSHGHPRKSIAQHSVECQQSTRLAHLCRPCDDLDPQGARTLYQRSLRHRSGQHGLRPRFYNHRFMLGTVSLGTFSKEQRSDQTSHASGSARDQSRHLSILPTEKSTMSTS